MMPATDRYKLWQIVLIFLAMSSPFCSWPFRLNILIEYPLLQHFAHYAYYQAPAQHPPKCPRMVGLFVVKDLYVHGTAVNLYVFGGGSLNYYPDPKEVPQGWLWSMPPWFLDQTYPVVIGNWFAQAHEGY
ncbi:MAG TPA: hypothetical protein VG722_00715 [Tepidisphaeraceae bacterium]|nr:hypothetical protein [Tepidisphaeraceae bacterium]